jgi:hypothetical protein
MVSGAVPYAGRGARAAATLLLSSIGTAALACEQPSLPDIQENVGDRDQRERIFEETRNYADQMIAYVNCVQAELVAAGGDEAPTLSRTLLVLRNNVAVAEVISVTELFHERVAPVQSLQIGALIDAESATCLSMSRIDQTFIVDDRAVLFKQRNRKIHLNVLENVCAGLERNRAFTFDMGSSTQGPAVPRHVPLSAQLCRGDFIYVLDRVTPPYPCRLGAFYEISDNEARLLLEPNDEVAVIVTLTGDSADTAGEELPAP